MFRHILVVCTGNLCRSPLAAAMLRRALPGRRIESSGLAAPVGSAADPIVREQAQADGLSLEEHRARQVSEEMLRAADLVLVMSEAQRRALGRLDPACLGKTMLLGHWRDDPREIPDPHRHSRECYRQVFEAITRAVHDWQARL